MSETNAALLRDMISGASSGTPQGIEAAAKLLADDVRLWQQGTGWIGKGDKLSIWTQGMEAGMKVVPTIRSILAEGDRVAAEMTMAVGDREMLVIMFATIRDGQIVLGHEYFPPADVGVIFG